MMAAAGFLSFRVIHTPEHTIQPHEQFSSQVRERRREKPQKEPGHLFVQAAEEPATHSL